MTLLTAANQNSMLRRIPFIDQMRGFIFLLMAFDHALHAYGYNWGRFWFFRDFDRSPIFDALYLFNQSIIMPVLFFTFGAYVIPKIQHMGLRGFWKDRLIKHGIPFMIGIPLIVPILSYPKFHVYVNSGPSYMEYWSDLFFSQYVQAGPYWVMYAIVLYTAVFLGINKFFPKLVPWMIKKLRTIMENPVKTCSLFLAFSAVVFGLSDFIWGAPWWIGFAKLFYLQGSKFIMNFVYFALGAAFVQSHIFSDGKIWPQIEKRLPAFAITTVVLGLCYTLYAHFFHEQAYDSHNHLRFLLRNEADLEWILEKLSTAAPWLLARTTLLSALCFFQFLTILIYFSKRSKTPAPLWNSLAACCWGIFIFHDPVVVWGQFLLNDLSWPIVVKFGVVFIACMGFAWPLSHFLLKVRYVRRVFELD